LVNRAVGHRHCVDASAWTGYPETIAIGSRSISRSGSRCPAMARAGHRTRAGHRSGNAGDGRASPGLSPAPAAPTCRENIRYGYLRAGIWRSGMDRCCLCTGMPGRYMAEDERPCRLTITRVDDGSAYRHAADDQVPRALFDCQPPDTAAPR
jgi:hypothetical protein